MPTDLSTLALIEARGAVFGYRRRPIVRADALALERGKCLGIFGPNGAGKTTLVRGLIGLLRPLAGAVSRQGTPAGDPRKRRGRLRFGYLPQHRAIDPHWPMTAMDAAAMAISSRRWLGWMPWSRQRLRETMRRLDVEGLAGRSFAKLSGGQQQRVLLAGALAASPDILFLDEPTDGLDIRSRQVLLAALSDTMARGLCTVVISHDVEDLLRLSHHVAWLHPAEESGAPSAVEVVAPQDFAGRITAARGAA